MASGRRGVKRTFEELISTPSGSESERFSGDTIRDAVFQLLDHHQNLDALLEEAVWHPDQNQTKKKRIEDGSGDSCGSSTTDFTVDSFVSLLTSESKEQGAELSTTSALTCAKKLRGISEGQGDDESKAAKISILVEVIKCLKRRNQFNERLFVNQLCSAGRGVRAEVLWILNKEFIMTVDTYISCNLGKTHMFEALPGNIIEMCKQLSVGEESKRQLEVISDLMTLLIRQGYAQRSSELDQPTKNMKKVTVAVLDSVMKGILKNIATLGLPDQNPFFLAFNHGGLDVDTIKRCSTHLLAVTMSYSPDLKVSQALIQQSKWKFANTSSSLSTLYKQLMLVFDAKEVLNIIKRVLERQEVNWETVLSFAATFLVLFKDASEFFKGLVRSLLQQAFDNLEVEHLIMGFLLARQACLEGPHVFPSYQEWFQESFGSSSSPANNKKAFFLLVKFMTDIVPFETANYLRVHILKPPFIPVKCNQVYSDYIMLAKTRLSDLKEPLDPQVGIYTSAKSDGAQIEEHIGNDIDRALMSFEQTGKVPTIIIEASIFRKPYYIGKFLPALLKTRPLPDSPDIRMDFVTALNQSGKIPINMYKEYISSCKKETEQLLDGLFGEDDMENVLLEPMEQLQATLEQLPEVVEREIDNKERKDSEIGSTLSVIKERIDEILGPGSQIIQVDVEPVALEHKGQISGEARKISDLFLCTYCKLAAIVSSEDHNQQIFSRKFIEIMVSHPKLVPVLYRRIWDKVILEGEKLDGTMILGLAHFLSVFMDLTDKVPSVRLSNRGTNQLEDFATLVLRNLPLHTGQWMTFSFRVLTHFFRFSECIQAISPPVQTIICQKFQFLSYRLCPEYHKFIPVESELPILEEQGTAIKLLNSDDFKMLCEDQRLSFKDWLSFECQVIPDEDLFTNIDRLSFYDMLIHRIYLPFSAEKGGCNGSYREACIAVFSAIIKFQMTADSDDVPLPKRNTRGKSCQHIVQFLQNLCLNPIRDEAECGESDMEQDGSEEETADPACWIVEVTKKMTSQYGNEVIPVCFRIISQLPPQLYYTDGIGTVPSPEKLKSSLRFTARYLLNYMNDGLCLTYQCFSHLLKGILSFNSRECMEKFLDYTLHIVAVMIHYDKVEWLLERLNFQEKERESVFSRFLLPKWREWTKSEVEGGDVPRPARNRMDIPLQTCGFYSAIRQGDYSASQIFDTLEPYTTYPRMLHDFVLVTMADTQLQKEQSTRWKNIGEACRRVVCGYPKYLIRYAKDLQNHLNYIPCLSLRLGSVSFIRMLMLTPDPELQLLLEEEEVMTALMEIYTKVGEVFDEGPETQLTDCHQPLTIDVIVACSEFMKRCICLCSKEVLSEIPETQLKKAGLLSSVVNKQEEMDL